MSRTLLSLLAGSALLSGLLLAGCGSQPSSGSPTSPATSSGAPSTSASSKTAPSTPGGTVGAPSETAASASGGSPATTAGGIAAPPSKATASAPSDALPGGAIPATAPTRPLFLLVDSPAEDIEVDSPTLTVAGSTIPGAVVSVNDDLARVGPDGKFSVQIQLEEGPNDVEVVASDRQGNEQSVIRSVIYEP